MKARFTSNITMASVGFAALLVLVAGASCSLGLDESLIDKATDAGGLPPDGAQPDPSDDGGPDGGGSVGPGAAACTKDEDCTTSHGCLTGKCDLSRKSCAYDVCRPSACNAAACDQNARTCGAPATYKYRATQFTVGAQISCRRCAAAVHPWLFVLTPTGVVAFNVSNPANATPPQAPVVGLGFIPSALVQSGSRVWMLGGASGPGPSRIQLAYVDVPADPFATKIAAKTILASYDRPAEATLLFPRGGDSALLVGNVAQFPSTFIEAPLDEPVAISTTPVLVPQSFAPSAVSGKRLLVSAVLDQAAQFAFVEEAGSPAPTTAPVVNLAEAGAVSVHRTFAQSPDGAIFWATGVHHEAGLGVTTRAARGYFLVPNEAGPIEDGAGIDIEVYDGQPVGANAAIFGPNQATAAMLDAKTVMIATQARENDQQTVVQFVAREPLGLLKEADGTTPRRQLLPVPIGAFVAATASNGVGYLVANDQDGQAPSATVYTFDPACAP